MSCIMRTGVIGSMNLKCTLGTLLLLEMGFERLEEFYISIVMSETNHNIAVTSMDPKLFHMEQ